MEKPEDDSEWLSHLGDSLHRDIMQAGRTAPPEVHAAIVAIAHEYASIVPGLDDPFIATYAAGFYVMRTERTGESVESQGDRLWSLFEVARDGVEGARAAASHLIGIQQLISVAQEWRSRTGGSQ